MRKKLVKAIQTNNIEKCVSLIQECSEEDINKIDKNGDTALTWAAAEGLGEVCKLLIPKMSNAAVNAINKDDNNTALYWAAVNGLGEVCKLLILKMSNAAVNAINKDDNNTALYWAAAKGLGEVCELLIPRMIKEVINLINKSNNCTVLHMIIKNIKHINNPEVIIKLLLKENLFLINVKDKNGKTALDYAKNKNSNITELLTKYKSKEIYSLDDSSDEEDEKVENYNIVDKLKGFKNEFSNVQGWQKHQNLELSFITHAAGIYLFYSNAVQKKYYELKKTKLFVQRQVLLPTISCVDIEKQNTQLAIEYKNRTILSNNFKINIESSNNNENNITFLAYLRLQNRSEKRYLKNNEDNKIKQPENLTVKWQNKSCIISSITANPKTNPEEIRYLRSNEVKYENTRNLTYKEICKINKHNLNTDWKTFLIKNEIPAEDNDICIFYYHLFGCETIKNPAAFIYNKMVIDLIKNNKISWGDALDSQLLPMVMTDAIMAARVINSDYNKFMPHKYLYDKDYHTLGYYGCYPGNHKNNAAILLKKEIDITEKWLTWKLGNVIANYMIKNCCEKKDDEAVKSIYELILDVAQEWYPGVLGDVQII